MSGLAPAAPRPSVGRLVPALALIFLGSLWGATFGMAKLAGAAGAHPLGYALWQTGGSAAVLFALAVLRGRPTPLSLRHVGYYALTGVLGVSIPLSNMYNALGHIPAGLAALVASTVPLLTYAFARLLKAEPASARRLAGVMLGFAGAALILGPRASLPAPEMAIWVAIAFATPCCYAIANVLTQRWRPSEGDSLALAAGMCMAAAASLLPAAWVADAMYLPFPPGGLRDWITILQIAVSTVAYLTFFELLRYVGPIYFAQVGYVVTATGMAWGIVVFGETHSAYIWGALALIFGGIALVRPR
jgi:drug/metabolite transporter (DMT)-like permease